MHKCTGSDSVFGKLIAHVWCTKTVTNTGVFGTLLALLFLYGVDLTWYVLNCEGDVLALPSPIVKV